MTTFFLIRHGRTSWIGHALAGHTPGVGLDETGRLQAQRLATRLAGAPIAAIYSSPLQRTMETAAPIANALSLQVQPRPRLIEVDFGDWTGRTMAELAADPLWERFNAFRSSVRAPSGDLMLDVQSRMVHELEELRGLHPNETVAVVSHQDAIKAAIAHFAGVPLDLFHRFEISPASISVVALSARGPQIIGVNDTVGL
jgi:probable phosphoglycerate mutase